MKIMLFKKCSISVNYLNKKSHEPNCLEEKKSVVRAKKTTQSQDGRFENQDLMDATSGVDVGVA